MDEDAVVGVTSNPTIFQKALSEGDVYDDQLRELLREEDDPKEIFVRARRRRHPRRVRPVPRHVGLDPGLDGYVSLEVEPGLAYDTDGTIEQAQRFHDWVDRPNLYVKIPAPRPDCQRSRR